MEVVDTFKATKPACYEIIGCKITMDYNKYFWCWSIYIPPISQKLTKLEILKEIFVLTESKMSVGDVKLYTGDFNLPFLKWKKGQPLIPSNDLLMEFVEEITIRNLIQLNHIRNEKGIILDLLLTNNDNQFSTAEKAISMLKPSSIHHNPISITFSFETGMKNKKSSKVIVQNFDCKYASDRIMESTNCTLPFKNGVFLFTKEEMSTITLSLKEIVIASTIKRTLNIPLWASTHPWLNRDIKYFKLLKEYRNHYKLYKLNPSIESRQILHTKQKILVERYNWLKSNTLKSLMTTDESHNQNFFDLVKLSKGRSTLPSKLILNGKMYEEVLKLDALIETFKANFDTTILYHIDNSHIKTIYEKYKTHVNKIWDKFNLSFTYEEVANTIMKLRDRKNPGPMSIPVELFKKNYEYFTYLLTDIFNMILIDGSLPLGWNEAFLLPIFKKGNRMDANNYRGVAISSVRLKIYDQLITKRLYQSVEGIISKTQHGFNKERNITTNHIETVHFVQKAMLKKASVDII